MIKKTDLKDYFCSFLISGWCYGLNKIILNRIFYRLLWIIFVSFAFGLCIHGLHENISDFYKFDVITKTQTVSADSIEFPQITLCKFNASLTLRDLKPNPHVSLSREEFIKLAKQQPSMNVDDSKSFWQFNAQYLSPPVEITLFNKYSQITCLKFNCPTTPEDTPLIQTNAEDFYDGFFANLAFNTDHDKPTLIYIDRYGTNPIYSNPNLILSSGYAAFVSISETIETQLPEPYTECVYSEKGLSELVDMAYDYNFNRYYDKTTCLFICKRKYASEKLNCSLPRINEKKYETSCFEFRDEFDTYLGHFNESCSECKEECNQTIYHLEKNIFIGANDSNKNAVRIVVRFGNLKTTRITQSISLSSWNLISKLGGLTGFFIGFKFLSFFDILEFLIEFTYRGIKKILNY